MDIPYHSYWTINRYYLNDKSRNSSSKPRPSDGGSTHLKNENQLSPLRSRAGVNGREAYFYFLLSARLNCLKPYSGTCTEIKIVFNPIKHWGW